MDKIDNGQKTEDCNIKTKAANFTSDVSNKARKNTNNNFFNMHPENDKINYRSPIKHKPGNSAYNNILKEGKKTLLLSDSICRRFKMNQFNRFLSNKKAFMKCFPGATTNELHHYAIPTLEEQCPDIVIICAGINDLKRLKPVQIVENINSIVNLCHETGVNDIFVSAVTPMYGFQSKIDEVNNLLWLQHEQLNFMLINNDNILPHKHLWKDKVHLNDNGLTLLANNYINALNTHVSACGFS